MIEGILILVTGIGIVFMFCSAEKEAENDERRN